MAGMVGYASRNTSISFQQMLDHVDTLSCFGYDSVGLAGVDQRTAVLQRERVVGQTAQLRKIVHDSCCSFKTIIGHQRWATHGAPGVRNTHPIFDQTGRLAVAQQGIIENDRELRELLRPGFSLRGETDTEVFTFLLGDVYEEMVRSKETAGGSLVRTALAEAVKKAGGNFSLFVIAVDEPETMVAARGGRNTFFGARGLDDESQLLITSPTPHALPGFQPFHKLNLTERSVLTINPRI